MLFWIYCLEYSRAQVNTLTIKYKYSYVEQWQSKDISVTFRMYQLNFDENNKQTYMKYWDTYQEHFIEDNL